MEVHTKLLVLQPDLTESPLKTEPSQLECETELQSLAEQRKSNDLKERLKRYLIEHPRNFSAAARQLNVSRSTVLRIIAEHQEEFDDLEQGYLDELEEKAILATQGRTVDEEFSFNEALKVLERLRPERWSVASRKKPKAATGGGISRETMEMLRSLNAK